MADVVARDLTLSTAHRRLTMQKFVRRKSTIAFFMCLPLILVVACLVVYPAFYSISLAMMNKSMQHFVGFGNFTFLFKRNTFWMVVEQTVLFAVTAVIFKALIGFIAAHFVHNLPAKGQRKWRGMLLIPWVIPPAMSTLAWFWLLDPSYSAFNWAFLQRLQLGFCPARHPPSGLARQPVLGALCGHPRQRLGRLAILPDHVPCGAQIG